MRPLQYCLLAGAAILIAGSQPLQLNVLYDCGSGSQSIKVLSCSGAGDDATCDVQPYTGSKLGPRTQSTRHAVLASLKDCHPRPAASNSSLKPGDAVEVLLFGEWTKGQLLSIDQNQYNVQLPDGAKYWMRGSQVRKLTPSAPSGQPPRPGLTVCGEKMDGKYSSPSGFPNIVFHSGKASVEGDEEVECWMGGGRIYLHTAGTRADQDFIMGINSDGTLDTPLGEIRKKGNQ